MLEGPKGIGRFQGTVTWTDTQTGAEIQAGTIDRAVAKSEQIIMEITSPLGTYDIALEAEDPGNYSGTWDLNKGKATGEVVGTVQALGAGQYRLAGPWGDGMLTWDCVLERVKAGKKA
jgi:hypothetical protein